MDRKKKKKRSVASTDYRSMLDSDGDIVVGAFARQQRRRRILVAVVGLGLIGVGVWLYLALQRTESVDVTERYVVAVECAKCGYRGIMEVKMGQEAFPRACPKCRERACYGLWECRNCGHQFAYRAAGEVRCAACGSRLVGAAETVAPPQTVTPPENQK